MEAKSIAVLEVGDLQLCVIQSWPVQCGVPCDCYVHCWSGSLGEKHDFAPVFGRTSRRVGANRLCLDMFGD